MFSPAHLLHLQSPHQCYHHYISCQEFVRGAKNGISDLPYQSAHLTDNQFLCNFNTSSPEKRLCNTWSPLSASVSTIASTLQRMILPRGSIQAVQLPCMSTGWPEPTFWCSVPWPPTNFLSSPIPHPQSFTVQCCNGNIAFIRRKVCAKTVEDDNDQYLTFFSVNIILIYILVMTTQISLKIIEFLSCCYKRL